MSADNPQPFILEVTATATVRVLIYADDLDTADDILDGRFNELREALRTTAALPVDGSPAEIYVHFDGDARPAFHHEVDSTESLIPGAYTYDTCDSEEHYS